MTDSSYARAGVNITAGGRAVELMSAAVRSTYGPEVLLGIGAFGGLFDAARLQNMRHPVLVGSTDGVGTKTVVSGALDRYENLGQDIVNHCINDILVQGAEPLFFLDYVAFPRLEPEIVARVVAGVSAACRAAGCAVLGGETAEMPGVYSVGQMDIAGTVVGVVEKDEIIDGTRIAAGDKLIGLPSVGLHTNGFSLVRTIFTPDEYDSYSERLGCSLGEALARPHLSYLPLVRQLRSAVDVKGLAHITGGGLIENTPRIIPKGLGARFDRSAWEVPQLFALIQEAGNVDAMEMFRVFNMGIGMVVVVARQEVAAAQDTLRQAGVEAPVIGEIIPVGEGPRVQL